MKKRKLCCICMSIMLFILCVNPVVASEIESNGSLKTNESELTTTDTIVPMVTDVEELLAPMSVEEAVPNAQTTTETYHYDYTYTQPNNLVVLSPSSVSTTTVVEKAYPIIFASEGGYSSVNANDNGAVSIGRLQWHANRALVLLRVIISDSQDVPSARYYLGDSLYNEITSSSTSWISRKFTTEEAVKVTTFLNNTAVSKTVQDKMAMADIASYVNHGITMGIRNVPTLIYFADLENQGGYSRSKQCAETAINSNLCSSYGALTLNEIYLSAVSNSVMGKKEYLYRRANAYKACAELGYPYCQSWDRLMPCVLTSYKTETFVGEAWLQWALNSYGGANLEITDQYDNATKTAIKLFQEMNGLSADGQAGRDTIKILMTMIVNSKSYKADAYVPFLKLLTSSDAWTVAVDGGSFSLGAKCSIASANLIYTSSNPSVATVSTSGIVTPVAPGIANVTIQAQGYDLSKKVTITVTSPGEGNVAPIFSSNVYRVSGDVITGITTIPTTVETFKTNISVTNGIVKVCDAKGNEISGNVGTGSKVSIYDVNGNLNVTYTIIIYGDTNGDGNIWATDYALIKNQIMTGKQLLSGAYSIAADVNRDGNIYATDYAAIKNYIMKGTKINQN